MPKEFTPFPPNRLIPGINEEDGPAFTGLPPTEEAQQALSRQNRHTRIVFGSIALLCSGAAAAGFWATSQDIHPSALPAPNYATPYAPSESSGQPSFASPSPSMSAELPTESTALLPSPATAPSILQSPAAQSPNTQASLPVALFTPDVQPDNTQPAQGTPTTRGAANTPPRSTTKAECPPVNGMYVCGPGEYAIQATDRPEQKAFPLTGQKVTAECYLRPAGSTNSANDWIIVNDESQPAGQMSGYVQRKNLKGADAANIPAC